MSTPAPIVAGRCGDRGWLIDITAGTPGDWARRLRTQSWAEQLLEDVVPSDTSVLVIARSGAPMDDVNRRIISVPVAAPPLASDPNPHVHCATRKLTIPVRYDGCDLSEVSGRLGLSVRQVVELHTNATYTVGFFGFAPGFAYLRGLDATLQLPRRADPRTHVDAGAIAIAGRYSVIYPGRTPGGWHIIGSTTERLWDLDADPPNRLTVGDLIRFQAIT